MGIDYSKIYSALSTTEGKKQQEVERAIAKFKELKDISTVDDAKCFLIENYGIEIGCTKLDSDGILTIEEDEKRFSVNLQCSNKVIEFNYKKREVV